MCVYALLQPKTLQGTCSCFSLLKKKPLCAQLWRHRSENTARQRSEPPTRRAKPEKPTLPVQVWKECQHFRVKEWRKAPESKSSALLKNADGRVSPQASAACHQSHLMPRPVEAFHTGTLRFVYFHIEDEAEQLVHNQDCRPKPGSGNLSRQDWRR